MFCSTRAAAPPQWMACMVSQGASREVIAIRRATCELAGTAVARVALLRAAVAAGQHPPA